MAMLPRAGPERPVGVGVAQLDLEAGAVELNRTRCVAAIDEAASAGAELVVLPELASSGYRLDDRQGALAVAETIPGPATEAWTAAAARHGCWVVGGVCERDGDGLFNTAAVVGPDGPVARYRKLHLFAGEK